MRSVCSMRQIISQQYIRSRPSCIASRSQRACTYSFLHRTYCLLKSCGVSSLSRQHPLSAAATPTSTGPTPTMAPSTSGVYMYAMRAASHFSRLQGSCSSGHALSGKCMSVHGCIVLSRCFSQGTGSLGDGSTGTPAEADRWSEGSAGMHIPVREGELSKHGNLLKSPKQRFVLTPSLAKLVRELIWPGDSLREETATIISANEGPGFLSRELLGSGASRVLALCRHGQFGPALEVVQSETSVGDQFFRWQHADLFQLQYHGDRDIRPPVARLEEVFQDIDPVAWEDDIAVKVVGALPQDGERKHAYVLASLILERLSMFSFGRVQFNVFMSKNCYSTLIHPPGSMKSYRAMSALYQVSCDVKLLHHEPLISFKLPRKTPRKAPTGVKKKDGPGEDLCLVQITPKRDLFTRHQLQQWEAFIFVFFVRQALARRTEKLHKVIEAWAPGSSEVIADLGYDKKTVTGQVSGDDLLALFTRICHLDNFNGAWMGEEVMGWAAEPGRHGADLSTSELSQALGSANLT